MTSSVFFKFKSQKEPQRVTFDGTGITVFELKREIISISGLGDGTNFDLCVFDDSGTEEYTDDTTIIPRSSTVIVQRVPPSLGPGRGKAARYVTGKAPIKAISKTTTTAPATSFPDLNSAVTEEDRLAAILAADKTSWEQQQQEMALQKRVTYKGPNKRPLNVPDHDPPPKYVCHRCNQPGHWIQMCPTNDDPNFQQQPKMKRTTGIPKSFIRNADTADEATRQAGQMMTDADGKTVIVVPDSATWAKVEAKMSATAALKQEAEAHTANKELQELGLECPLDKKLYKDPIKTPCCGTTYCSECLDNALVDSDLTCPNCSTNPCIFEDAVPDEEMIAKIRKYEEDTAAEKKAKEEAAKSPPPEAVKDEAKSPQAVEQEKPKSPSPKPSPTPSNTSNPKKRPAEEPLQNVRTPPKAPKSMLQAQQQTIPAGFDANFIEAMSQYAPANFGVNNNNNQLPQPNMFNPQMMGMMGMNMPGMMGMPNAMMNPMMMGMQQNGRGFNGGMNGNMGYNQGMNGYGQQNGWQQGGGWGMNNSQQQFGYGQGHEGGGGGSSAYARQPVNPNRARGRQQRQARNNDYNTL